MQFLISIIYECIQGEQKMRMSWPGNVACMVNTVKSYKIVMGKLEGKEPLLRHRCKWEDDTEMLFCVIC
jgi:hypothetical protein